jgi:hypothetical protein
VGEKGRGGAADVVKACHPEHNNLSFLLDVLIFRRVDATSDSLSFQDESDHHQERLQSRLCRLAGVAEKIVICYKMPISAVLASPDTRTAELTAEECIQGALLTRYLLDHEPEFVRLYKLQQDVRNTESPTLNCMKMTFSFDQGMET